MLMIRSFASTETELIWSGRRSRKLPPDIQAVAINGGGAITASSFPGKQKITAAVNGGGEIDLTAMPVKDATAAVNGGAVQQAAAAISGAKADPQAITLLFRPDPTVWDGRYAGNPWLQEPESTT